MMFLFPFPPGSGQRTHAGQINLELNTWAVPVTCIITVIITRGRKLHLILLGYHNFDKYKFQNHFISKTLNKGVCVIFSEILFLILCSS